MENQLELKFGSDILLRYKDLNYKLWFALAEFVDNSTHSYYENKDELDRSRNEVFSVKINFDKKNLFKIVDNAYGMDKSDIEDLFLVGRTKPKSKSGIQRSEFGMGFKTGGFWLGKKITIRTKKFNHPYTYSAVLDINKITDGNKKIDINEKIEHDIKDSFTIIQVEDFHKSFSNYVAEKTKDILRSIYKNDIENNIMKLYWNGVELETYKREILKDDNGDEYLWKLDFDVNGKKINGWVGLLDAGTKYGSSRKHGGFSVSRNKRMLHCFPDYYKPYSIFGEQEGGTNDLVNQRVFGHLEISNEFGVTQAKDNIVFEGDEDEILNEKLKELCAEAVNECKVGSKYSKNKNKVNRVVQQNVSQMISSEDINDIIDSTVNLIDDDEAMNEAYEYINKLKKRDSRPNYVFETKGNVNRKINVYLDENCSERTPYLHTDPVTNDDEITVIINPNHPYFIEQHSSNDKMETFILSCIFDGITESILMKTKEEKIKSESFKLIKDKFLRLKFNIKS